MLNIQEFGYKIVLPYILGYYDITGNVTINKLAKRCTLFGEVTSES